MFWFVTKLKSHMFLDQFVSVSPTYYTVTDDDHLTQSDETQNILPAIDDPHFLEPHIASCCLTRQGDPQFRVVVIGIFCTVCVCHVVIRYRQLEVVETEIT